MSYRGDFYIPQNIIGYTGNINHNPTVYFKNGTSYGHITYNKEENGCIDGANAEKISERAVKRGYNQIGTLGSGNHYLEIQVANRRDCHRRPAHFKFRSGTLHTGIVSR